METLFGSGPPTKNLLKAQSHSASSLHRASVYHVNTSAKAIDGEKEGTSCLALPKALLLFALCTKMLVCKPRGGGKVHVTLTYSCSNTTSSSSLNCLLPRVVHITISNDNERRKRRSPPPRIPNSSVFLEVFVRSEI